MTPPRRRSAGLALASLLAVLFATPAHAAEPGPADTLAQVVPMAPVEVSTTRMGDRPVVAASRLRPLVHPFPFGA